MASARRTRKGQSASRLKLLNLTSLLLKCPLELCIISARSTEFDALSNEVGRSGRGWGEDIRGLRVGVVGDPRPLFIYSPCNSADSILRHRTCQLRHTKTGSYSFTNNPCEPLTLLKTGIIYAPSAFNGRFRQMSSGPASR
jgi:hypothetical protein